MPAAPSLSMRASMSVPGLLSPIVLDGRKLVDGGRLRHTMMRALGPINAANILAGHALVESGTMIGKAVAAGWE